MAPQGNTKNAVQEAPYTAQEAKFSAHKRKRICSNNLAPALAGKQKYRIIPHAVRPNGRCVGGCSPAQACGALPPTVAAFLFSRGIIARKLGMVSICETGRAPGVSLLPFYPGGGPCQVVFVAFPRKSWYNTFVCRAIRTGRARAPRQRM